MDIKNIIKQARLNEGLTMKEVATKVGVSEATISRWESGEINDMRRRNIIAISEVLEIPPNVIMGWDEPEFKMKSPVDEIKESYEALTLENRTIVKNIIEGLILKQKK